MDAHLAFRGVGGPRLHLGVCGSVAAYRALDLVRQWQDAGVSVSATLTPSPEIRHAADVRRTRRGPGIHGPLR